MPTINTALLNDDTWSTDLGEAADVTYSFMTSWPGATDFKPVSSSGQALILEALQAFSAVANITFTLVPKGGTADIMFGQANLSPDDGETYWYGTGTKLADNLELYTSADTFFSNTNQPTPVNLFLALHELGNATGLYDFSGLTLSQDATLGLPESEANVNYSVMATNIVNAYPTTQNGLEIYPSTPQLLDIEALQYLYGANENGFTAGATKTSAGLVYSFTTDNAPECIWVGNAVKGTTTFDFSACTGPVTINLNAGSFSSTGNTTVAELAGGVAIPAGTPYDNISIAYNTVIQNAIGNNSDDTFIGNSSNDTLTGGTGNDTFIIGTGTDTIVGKGGTNTVVFLDPIGDYTFTVDSTDDLVVGSGIGSAILNGVATLTGLTTLQFADTTISAAVIQGHDKVETGGTYLLGDSLMAIFDATGTGSSNTTVHYFEVGSDTAVNITSERASSVTGGINRLDQLSAADNDLTTVTITGSQYFHLGATAHHLANADDGVVTDIGATATSPTTIASSLTLIDASATTGGVYILAGATNTSSAGDFVNGSSLNANVTITYTGLTIRGGSGTDHIENDATDGIVTDGNGNGDTVILGGANASVNVGTGSGDSVFVGYSHIGTDESPGTACGDMVTFFGAGAELIVGNGAKAGSTAGTANIGQTGLQGEQTGTMIDFSSVTSSSNISNENAAVASAATLTAAENAAVQALNAAGVAYFSFDHNQYFIATNHAETSVSGDDAVVCLVGTSGFADSNPFWGTDSGGIVTLHQLPVGS